MTEFELVIEKVGVSDDEYEIQTISFDNGKFVDEGDVLLEIETSKSLVEIESPVSGFVYYFYNEGESVKVGDVVAVISENESFDASNYKFNPTVLQNSTSIVNELTEKTDSFISNRAARIISDVSELKNGNREPLLDAKAVTLFIANEVLCLGLDESYLDRRVVIIGAGVFSQVIIEAIRMHGKYNVVGLIDNDVPVGHFIDGVPVLGGDDILEGVLELGIKNAVIGFGKIGQQQYRMKVFDLYREKGFVFPNIIHPQAVISDDLVIGEGNIILSSANISKCVNIGNNCLINIGAKISHHCNVGDNVQFSPGALVAGSVTIRSNTVIGMGVTTTYGVTIGENVIINNGAQVISNVKDDSIKK